jgi:hypothetical protein
MELNYNKEDSQIMIITREYKINKEKLREDFLSSEYEHKRRWFFNTFSEIEQNHIRTKLYNQMNEMRTDIYFFPWFEHNYKQINTREINTISRVKNSWIKLQTNEVVHEEYSPYESITLTHKGLQVVASPLKKASLSDDNKNLDNIIQQNNFINTYIKVLGEKLKRIKNPINPLTFKNQEKEIERPLFIPYETLPNLQFSFKKDNMEIIRRNL